MEGVKVRVLLKPLTRGWATTSEPLGPKSKASLDFGGALSVTVKLAEVLPNAEYTVGLNVYGADVPILGGARRCAFHPGPIVLDGVSKRLINQYALGTVRVGENGKAKFRASLPVSRGTYDVQLWVVKGPLPDVSAICYKSGLTFGDSDVLTAYAPASCPRTSLSFVVTGCARSGTAFASRLMSILGLPCEHEKVFSRRAVTSGSLDLSQPERDRWGESSCMAAPVLDRLPRGAVVFHQVRNPVKVVRSLMGWNMFLRPYNAFSEFTLQHLPEISPDEPRLRQCMKYWTGWNRLVERMGRYDHLVYERYRLEDLSRLETGTLQRVAGLLGHAREADACRRTLEAVPTNYNTRRRHPGDPAVKWSSLPDGEVKDQMRELARSYGYSRGELEEA